MKITDTNSLRASQEYLAAQELGLADLLASIPPRHPAQVTADECARIAIDVDDEAVRSRALCALSLLDKPLAVDLRRAIDGKPADEVSGG